MWKINLKASGSAKARILMIIATAVGAFSASQVSAARLDVREYSCSQIQALVQQKGAVVLTFTDNTYDRIVRNRNFCDFGYVTKNFSTATADTSACTIGKKCVEPIPLFRNHNRRF